MAKLLSFPKRASETQRRVQRREAKRFAMSLSVLSVAVVALILSENLNSRMHTTYILAGSPEHITKINRAIASAEPYDLVEDVLAEKKLAQKIGLLERNPGSIGQTPSALDQLRFGVLAGKYRITESSSHVRELEYVDSSDVTDRPVAIRDPQNFLVQNRDVFSVPFTSTKVILEQDQKESLRLLDSQGHPVGQADFNFDENGRLLSMKIQPLNL